MQQFFSLLELQVKIVFKKPFTPFERKTNVGRFCGGNDPPNVSIEQLLKVLGEIVSPGLCSSSLEKILIGDAGDFLSVHSDTSGLKDPRDSILN